MDAKELIRHLEFEYWGIVVAADFDWEENLVDFLLGRGISKDDIWEHRRGLAFEAGWPEPEWL